MSEINWKNKCWVTTIFLVREDGKVLLNWNKNLQAWMPIGGHIEPGENPEQAIIREVAEETGFEFEFHPLPEYTDKDVKVLKPNVIQIEKLPHHGEHINISFFGICTKYYDKKTTDENEELKWFSAEELEKTEMPKYENVKKRALEAIRTIYKSKCDKKV